MPLKDLGALAAMSARLPEELQKAQRRGVSKGALIVTKSIRGQIRVASGGDMKLSGVGKRGTKVGARYDVKGRVNPSALIRATGPMQLLEHNTKAHEIKPRKRRKFKALNLGGGKIRASVQHPGTRAKRPFEKGYLKSRDETGPVFDKEIQAAIRKVMA